MDRFWKWMEGKEYGVPDSKRLVERHEKIGLRFIYPTNQMLIGYMIEYLSENKVDMSETIPWHFQALIHIDGVYNWLKRAIVKLEDENVQQKKD